MESTSILERSRIAILNNLLSEEVDNCQETASTGSAHTNFRRTRWMYLHYRLPNQEQTAWCWVATALGIARFYDPGNPTSQCEAVNAILERTDACVEPGHPEVNTPWYFDRALHHFGNLAGSVHHGSISPQHLADQIRSGKPLVFGVDWPNGDGHVVAITGATTDGQLVQISDSSLGMTSMSYEKLLTSYNGNGWVAETYKTKSRWEN